MPRERVFIVHLSSKDSRIPKPKCLILLPFVPLQKRKRGILHLPIPLLEGLRIAQLSRRTMQKAHACMVYSSAHKGNSTKDTRHDHVRIHIRNCSLQVTIHLPWTFTHCLTCWQFGKVAKFTSSRRRASSKRPFRKSSTLPTPSGAFCEDNALQI